MKIHARIRIQVHKDNHKQIHRSDEGFFFFCLPGEREGKNVDYGSCQRFVKCKMNDVEKARLTSCKTEKVGGN